MPSEHLPSSRPSLAGHRSNSSANNNETDSPAGTPPQGGHGRTKSAKHVVGAGGRTHARVPSSKGLHKLTKAHGNEGSHTDLKKLGNNKQGSSSTTNLKKNSSHVSLKRNRSSADVQKRPRSAHDGEKRPASVHFEIGDQDDEVWEEASNPSTASPALSRSASRSAVSSGQSSLKPSANNSAPASPPHTLAPLASSSSIKPPPIPSSSAAPVTPTTTTNGLTHPNERSTTRQSSADAKNITERLLQRTHSHHKPTKMSLMTATPTSHTPDSHSPLAKSQSSTLNGTPHGHANQEVVSSRFVGGSGTPSENSPFLQQHHRRHQSADSHPIEEVKRAQSMGNLTHRGATDSEEESALAPRSRKSSQASTYYPPPQSRTQQKLWLQRASSNMEPAPGPPFNGLAGLHGYGAVNSLVNGAGYDGRDLRVRVQLEKTGLEYLVVRRYQDTVGRSIKRLAGLPGAEKMKRIPMQREGSKGGGAGFGLSQSLNSRFKGPGPGSVGKDKSSPTRGDGGGGGHRASGSYDGHSGSQEERSRGAREDGDTGVGAILQQMWQKSCELSASAD